jgi:type IV secretory pathway VirB10-like protein
MEISKATAGFLAATCVLAGAGGAYLASRGDAPAAAQEISRISPDPTATAVEQSEGVVAEATDPSVKAAADAPTAPAPAPPASSRRAPRAEAPRPEPRAPELATVRPPQTDERPATLPAIEAPRVVENIPEVRPPEPLGPVYEDLVVAADSVIGLQVESSVSSEQARVEDSVSARVTRDVKVGDRVAIPAGSRAIGEVTQVERGGRLKERARLGIRFTSIVLADGTRLPIATETIVREGDARGNASAAKIGGGALGGAIIGGILGGTKGAAIGGSVGAGAGTAAVMAGDRSSATLASGSPVTVRLQEPVTVTVEK